MVDVEILPGAADGTALSVTFKNPAACLLPPLQGILLPCPDRGLEPLAVDPGVVSHSKRAPEAEPVKAVLVGVVAAERAS